MLEPGKGPGTLWDFPSILVPSVYKSYLLRENIQTVQTLDHILKPKVLTIMIPTSSAGLESSQALLCVHVHTTDVCLGT